MLALSPFLQALAAIPGAAIFSPIDEAASAAPPGFRRRQWARVTVPRLPARRGRRAQGWDGGAGGRGLRGRGARLRPELRGGGPKTAAFQRLVQ